MMLAEAHELAPAALCALAERLSKVAEPSNNWVTAMTVKEMARLTGISESLIYDLCRLGVLRHSRHGRPGRRGTIRIGEDAIAEYRASCQQQGPPAPLPALRHIRLPRPS
jgi:excisionase family DNA binding protein